MGLITNKKGTSTMKVAVLVSGGVDSSVALKLLHALGHDLVAFYLKIWLEDEVSHLGNCPWEKDLEYVENICKTAGIPLQVISFQKEYHDKIVSYTIEETKAGRTPNPDVLCNQQVKFGIFYDEIKDEFEKIATGHYAQLENQNGINILKRSPDPIKDQTYFLCNLNQKQLEHAMFPIGHLNKKEVRELAKEFNLPNKDRKDSQGICFLGKFHFREFINHHLGNETGEIIEFETGKKLENHQGHWYYTIGQRQGIRLSGGPWYIVAKDPQKNHVFVSNNYETINLPRKKFEVEKINWINTMPQRKNLLVKIRHKSLPKPCLLEFIDKTSAKITLENKDQGIAPGQFAVFYDDDICLGGGVIK